MRLRLFCALNKTTPSKVVKTYLEDYLPSLKDMGFHGAGFEPKPKKEPKPKPAPKELDAIGKPEGYDAAFWAYTEAQGLKTNKAICARVGFSDQTIANWRNLGIPVANLPKIAEAFPDFTPPLW